DRNEQSWDLIERLNAETEGIVPPQIWVHCKVGLARSMAFKLMEKFICDLKNNVTEIDLAKMIIDVRKDRPGVFPYKAPFIECCRFLQSKCEKWEMKPEDGEPKQCFPCSIF
ncbi:MAG: protein-tyrosine phosphatase family protein, partial [Chlamydiota bacterium]